MSIRAPEVMRTGLLVLLCALVTPGRANAEAEFSRDYHRCIDESGGADFRMTACSEAESQRQDAAMTATYRAVMRTLSEPRRLALRDAQRLWIRFRDANCGFYGDPDGGTAARVAASGCIMSMTAERAAELLLFDVAD